MKSHPGHSQWGSTDGAQKGGAPRMGKEDGIHLMFTSLKQQKLDSINMELSR
jgi:hypothetical protein